MPSGELVINRCKIVYNPDITLAMYRELASHIEQIVDVSSELFWQESTEFSYLGSQIGGMWLVYPQSLTTQSQILIKDILNHYGDWTSDPKE
ncbi:hypothetical protein [Pseudanabaena sp. BC1403]|uniref:hypothetical protein n=1 Tax=Pseudanabaena sp. BC1403 TaxID=2043171 RepID=UPI000CD9A20A|nr:hypothetical protein [Pseudanabaena sp. BC1403]